MPGIRASTTSTTYAAIWTANRRSRNGQTWCVPDTAIHAIRVPASVPAKTPSADRHSTDTHRIRLMRNGDWKGEDGIRDLSL